MSQPILVSVVIPVYSGESFLSDLVGKLESVRQGWLKLDAPFKLSEAIFVADEPVDASEAVLTALRLEHKWVRLITLSRNFGQHPATVAGILHSSGDWVFTIDEDLQHDPEHFGQLLSAATTTHCDILYAKPSAAVHGTLFRDWGSRMYKTALSMATNNKHIQEFNSFRLLRGSIARAAASVCSHETYFDIALGWFSKRVSSVGLPLEDRRYIDTGKSGYSFYKLLSHARRLMISSQTKILRLGAVLGLISLAFSIILAIVIVVARLVSPDTIDVKGWTSQILATLFFGGLASFFLGICLEYLSSVLLHTQGKPTYFTVDRERDEIVCAFFSSGDRDVAVQHAANI